MTTGGSNFESGEDFVAMRLSIDVPTDGIQSLRELTQEMERLRVANEATNRSFDSFTQYLRTSAEESDRFTASMENLHQSLQRTAEQQQRMASGSATAGGLNAPAGYVDPFGGRSGRSPSEMAPVDLDSAQGQIDNLRDRDPRAYLNMQAQRGGLRSGDIPAGTPGEQQIQEAAARVHEREQEGTRQLQDNPPAQHIPKGWRQQIGADASIGDQMLNETEGRPSAAAPSALEGGALPRATTDNGYDDRPSSAVPPRPKKKAPGAVEQPFQESIADGESSIGRAAGIAQQVLNEFGPGGSYQGMGGLLRGGLGAAGKAAGGVEGAGAMSGLLKGAGVAGLGLTAGLAGYGAVQKAGETYQGLKDMGSVRGGGAAEGFGYEMSIRTMAMNPFLSTEQSRQIIQSALTDGYSGKAFDTVTQFMSSNLKEMNMDVATSTELLRKNVNEGGQSIAGLAANLGVLKEMAKTGDRSLPDLQQGFQQTSGTLINAGVAAPVAERTAMVAGQMFNDNQKLKDTGEQTVQAMSSPQGLAFMRAQGGLNIPAGVMPGAMPFMMKGDEMLQGSTKVIKDWALKFHNSAGRPAKGSEKYANAVYQWQLFLQQLGIPWASQSEKVQEMYDQLVYEGADPLGDATKKNDEAIKQQTSVQDKGVGMANFPHGFGLGSITESFKALGGAVGDFFSGGQFNPIQAARGLPDRLGKIPDAGRRYDIPMLTQIEGVYGQGGFDVLDENGKTVKLDRSDRGQMDKLSGGQYTVRQKGTQGAGISLTQAAQTGGGDNLKQRMQEVQGSVTIRLDPSAQKAGFSAPSTIQLTPHERQANMGYADAQPNNAPPGEDPITRGRGGW